MGRLRGSSCILVFGGTGRNAGASHIGPERQRGADRNSFCGRPLAALGPPFGSTGRNAGATEDKPSTGRNAGATKPEVTPKPEVTSDTGDALRGDDLHSTRGILHPP